MTVRAAEDRSRTRSSALSSSWDVKVSSAEGCLRSTTEAGNLQMMKIKTILTFDQTPEL